MTDDLIARLEENYTPEPNSGCWIWLGCVSRRKEAEYGLFRHKGFRWRAHRASWVAFRGQIPEGMAVCHKCDNTLCVNPSHLFLGSLGDNNKDRRRKKRDFWFKDNKKASAILAEARKLAIAPKGEKNGQSKLNNACVKKIRSLASNGITQRVIAKDFHVSQAVISTIVTRKTWQHVS